MMLIVDDAKTPPTTYTYDGMDRLATRTDALTRQESYQYDPGGNLTQFLDRKGQASTFTYDALNRRTSAQYADGSTVTFIYDAVGRLTRVTDSVSGAIDFYYDLLDRLILEVTPQGAVAYTYDAIGRRTTMTVAGQAPVTYQYDADSRLTQVAQGSLAVGLAYDAAGRRTSLTYPNGVTTTYTYDNANRVTRILYQGPSGVIEDLTYTYDAAGNRTSLSRANGTASLLPAAVATAAYDAANEQTQFGSATLTYDANGNLTNDGTNTYTWDVRNRLVGISGGVSASFSYDGLGRRLSKTINGVTTSYLYDGNDIVQELSSGAVTAIYLRSLNIDEPFIRQTGTGEFYHTDALGSTLVLSNSSGVATTTYSYEPFGNTTSTGTSSNPFQFTGRENDGTGFYYYRARYYGSLLMRFLQEDPINLGNGDKNLYTYAFNTPCGLVDPFGLSAKKKCIGVARFSAVGPNQARGTGALAKYGVAGHQSGTVAVSPAVFGLPFPEPAPGQKLTTEQLAERARTQKLLARYANEISISPEGLKVNGGPAPPYTVSDIGDPNIRRSKIPRFDIYGFASEAAALRFGIQQIQTTITLPRDLSCPPGFEEQ